MVVLGEEIEEGRANVVGRGGLVPDGAAPDATLRLLSAGFAREALFGFAVEDLAEAHVWRDAGDLVGAGTRRSTRPLSPKA